MVVIFLNYNEYFKIMQNSEYSIYKEKKGQTDKKTEFICKA